MVFSSTSYGLCIFSLHAISQAIRRKHNFEPSKLIKYICDTGETPPKDASCIGPSGYWYLAAQALSGKSNPSFKFVAAVAAYWYKVSTITFSTTDHYYINTKLTLRVRYAHRNVYFGFRPLARIALATDLVRVRFKRP